MYCVSLPISRFVSLPCLFHSSCLFHSVFLFIYTHAFYALYTIYYVTIALPLFIVWIYRVTYSGCRQLGELNSSPDSLLITARCGCTETGNAATPVLMCCLVLRCVVLRCLVLSCVVLSCFQVWKVFHCALWLFKDCKDSALVLTNIQSMQIRTHNIAYST